MFLCDFVWFCVYLYCFCVYFVQILYSHPTFVAIVCVFRSFCVYCVQCVPFWRVCTVCVVCVVYTVFRFGLFVQCVLWPMCTNPVFHCLQCVPNELFIKVPDWGVPKVHIVHTPVLACLYTSPFWRVCTVCVVCVLYTVSRLAILCVYCVYSLCVLCVYCVHSLYLCVYCVVCVYIV